MTVNPLKDQNFLIMFPLKQHIVTYYNIIPMPKCDHKKSIIIHVRNVILLKIEHKLLHKSLERACYKSVMVILQVINLKQH